MSLQRHRLDAEFALDPELCHLNHAAIGPWPRRTMEAVCRFATDNAARGSLDYLQWLEVETHLRHRLARLIGSDDSASIALLKNTSEALSVIAHGLPWRTGENVVGIAQEFPSNRIVWESLAPRGVRWRALDLDQSSDPEGDLCALCDEHTRLIAVSWVQYARGLRLDLARIGAFCRAHDIRFCVDAIQGLGAQPFSLADSGADFVVADGHKWMFGPEGLALFYAAPAHRQTLGLHQFGWHMVANPGDFEQYDWTPAPEARRFECGSPNLLAVHALEASLSLLEDVGISRIEPLIRERCDWLIEAIDRRGFELLSPRAPERRAGIITFRVPEVASERLYPALMANQVLCAQRGGGIRFSPHFHTTEETLTLAMERVEQLARG
ncbi:aminotransferase class V-fold PLP-dependent enzyme [Marichromatium bheemlicum]|uniref:Aminotransferase class V-fold PLP-dependent enzyme n=1 Tax=Marichromatium bheemlicum TaxID=365339 RepID=A0ABX1I5Q4_9GAMM|nr:aminotransferase class V-fold PLP-dependent enzyme [Marichromatium bheemlicum]NKN32491.1 aminotransferase class V-fold PLP-dependent enzyme [Marichromatium bheemlicum]